MRPVKTLPVAPSREDLPIPQATDDRQLDNIKSHLDLILLALEALAGIGSEAMLQAAETLNLTATLSNRVALWRLRSSNPLRKSHPVHRLFKAVPAGDCSVRGSGGRKKLDVEEARSLVLIACYLAKEHQELLRRAISLLEQSAVQNEEPHRTALLGDYLDTFGNLYQERMEAGQLAPEALSKLAFKLLIDLLFYSVANGHRRLWLALLDRAH